jgi:ion channel
LGLHCHLNLRAIGSNRLGDDMLQQIAFGGAVSVLNIAIHALVMTNVVMIAHSAFERSAIRFRFHHSILLVKVMVPTVFFLMITHILEVIVWALAYFIVGAAPVDADRLYFAFVNYTTLGYGDVVPVASWRLLGPLTAMNGMLLFGWSTAVIFEVLRKAADRMGVPSTI